MNASSPAALRPHRPHEEGPTSPAPLAWVRQHYPGGRVSILAEDGKASWRIVPVPRDVARIHYHGVDPDGTVVDRLEHQAYAESEDEAVIVVGILRAGTDHLPEWREQLREAGFRRTYPDAAASDPLSSLWHDGRPSGLFQLTIRSDVVGDGMRFGPSVHATYESDRATSWHNVCRVEAGPVGIRRHGDLAMRQGLPHGIDASKAGVAAAIAIRAARVARGGRFSTPLGGATRKG